MLQLVYELKKYYLASLELTHAGADNSFMIVLAAHKVDPEFKNVQRAERWAHMGTGIVFLGIGIYFTLAYTLNVL